MDSEFTTAIICNRIVVFSLTESTVNYKDYLLYGFF